MKSAKPVNEVFNLAEAAAYGDGKPGFIQLLETRCGGANIIALQSQQELTTHTNPAPVLIFLIQGIVEFIVNDEKKHLAAGDAIIMDAGTLHSVKAMENSKILLVKIDN